MMFGNYYGHMGGFGFGLGWIFMLIFWVLVVGAIIALARGASGSGCCGHWFGHGDHKPKEKGGNVMGILKERYAKGEITKEEFDKMKKDLE
jgi:putative membrane protein